MPKRRQVDMKIRSPSDKHGTDKGSAENSKGGIQ